MTIHGKSDLKHEFKPTVNLPYVIECPKKYGGCGFITEPIMEPVKICPKCGYDLEEGINRKYKDQLTR
ncbi:MAG: hypothetical protein ACOC6G_00320 [Thermoproteota archaeon]